MSKNKVDIQFLATACVTATKMDSSNRTLGLTLPSGDFLTNSTSLPSVL